MTLRRTRLLPLSAIAAALVCVAHPLGAQILPERPVVFADGRAVVSGDVSLTTSCSHAENDSGCTGDTGFFNYSDDEHSTLRMARFGVTTSVRINDHISALADMRLENTTPRPYGAYVRIHPFSDRDFDIQVGRIPWTFGAFSRHTYSNDNPLIGYPLAYQYLTSLRPDALPSSPEDLFRMRARGWLSSFPIGSTTPDAGLPLADAFRWDSGVQAHGTIGWIEAAGSVTTGSLAHPLFLDDNNGKHVSGRLAAKPLPGLVFGVSASRAPYVTTSAAEAAHANARDFTQRVIGADVEFSRDHYLVRFETVWSAYDLPTIEPRLDARGTLLEGRYKLTPRLFLAARADHLGFNTITGTIRTDTWEAPVTRWEIGGGYSVIRNVQLRTTFQHNSRDGGRVRQMTALAAQLLYWF